MGVLQDDRIRGLGRRDFQNRLDEGLLPPNGTLCESPPILPLLKVHGGVWVLVESISLLVDTLGATLARGHIEIAIGRSWLPDWTHFGPDCTIVLGGSCESRSLVPV